jgi:hypothetical protein
MTDKHTPGPWDVSPFNGITGPDRWYIAKCCKPKNTPKSPDEIKANEYLIAAAPDLLAALQEVEWVRRVSACGYDVGYQCPWCKASQVNGHTDDCKRQAAITKAMGGES